MVALIHSLLDSSSKSSMTYAPCLEHMTVAIKDPSVTKPKYRLDSCLLHFLVEVLLTLVGIPG